MTRLSLYTSKSNHCLIQKGIRQNSSNTCLTVYESAATGITDKDKGSALKHKLSKSMLLPSINNLSLFASKHMPLIWWPNPLQHSSFIDSFSGFFTNALCLMESRERRGPSITGREERWRRNIVCMTRGDELNVGYLHMKTDGMIPLLNWKCFYKPLPHYYGYLCGGWLIWALQSSPAS